MQLRYCKHKIFVLEVACFVVFVMNPTGASTIKLFMAVIYRFCNKLECLFLAGSVYCLWVRPGTYPRMEHLKAASLE